MQFSKKAADRTKQPTPHSWLTTSVKLPPAMSTQPLRCLLGQHGIHVASLWRKLDGSYCPDFGEVQVRWREHFSMLEAGTEIPPASLAESCFAGQKAREPLLDIPGFQLPTITGLGDAMRATACRKAPGPDNVPPEICQRFGNEMAVLWFPILRKTLLLSSEAIGLNGATLHRIPRPSGAPFALRLHIRLN